MTAPPDLHDDPGSDAASDPAPRDAARGDPGAEEAAPEDSSQDPSPAEDSGAEDENLGEDEEPGTGTGTETGAGTGAETEGDTGAEIGVETRTPEALYRIVRFGPERISGWCARLGADGAPEQTALVLEVDGAAVSEIPATLFRGELDPARFPTRNLGFADRLPFACWTGAPRHVALREASSGAVLHEQVLRTVDAALAPERGIWGALRPAPPTVLAGWLSVPPEEMPEKMRGELPGELPGDGGPDLVCRLDGTEFARLRARGAAGPAGTPCWQVRLPFAAFDGRLHRIEVIAELSGGPVSIARCERRLDPGEVPPIRVSFSAARPGRIDGRLENAGDAPSVMLQIDGEIRAEARIRAGGRFTLQTGAAGPMPALRPGVALESKPGAGLESNPGAGLDPGPGGRAWLSVPGLGPLDLPADWLHRRLAARIERGATPGGGWGWRLRLTAPLRLDVAEGGDGSGALPEAVRLVPKAGAAGGPRPRRLDLAVVPDEPFAKVAALDGPIEIGEAEIRDARTGARIGARLAAAAPDGPADPLREAGAPQVAAAVLRLRRRARDAAERAEGGRGKDGRGKDGRSKEGRGTAGHAAAWRRAGETGLVGWAIDLGRPGRPVTLEVLAGGAPILTIRADRALAAPLAPVPEAADLPIGFSIDLAALQGAGRLDGPGPHEITLRLAGRAAPLDGRATIPGRPATAARLPARLPALPLGVPEDRAELWAKLWTKLWAEDRLTPAPPALAELIVRLIEGRPRTAGETRADVADGDGAPLAAVLAGALRRAGAIVAGPEATGEATEHETSGAGPQEGPEPVGGGGPSLLRRLVRRDGPLPHHRRLPPFRPGEADALAVRLPLSGAARARLAAARSWPAAARAVLGDPGWAGALLDPAMPEDALILQALADLAATLDAGPETGPETETETGPDAGAPGRETGPDQGPISRPEPGPEPGAGPEADAAGADILVLPDASETGGGKAPGGLPPGDLRTAMPEIEILDRGGRRRAAAGGSGGDDSDGDGPGWASAAVSDNAAAALQARVGALLRETDLDAATQPLFARIGGPGGAAGRARIRRLLPAPPKSRADPLPTTAPPPPKASSDASPNIGPDASPGAPGAAPPGGIALVSAALRADRIAIRAVAGRPGRTLRLVRLPAPGTAPGAPPETLAALPLATPASGAPDGTPAETEHPLPAALLDGAAHALALLDPDDPASPPLWQGTYRATAEDLLARTCAPDDPARRRALLMRLAEAGRADVIAAALERPDAPDLPAGELLEMLLLARLRAQGGRDDRLEALFETALAFLAARGPGGEDVAARLRARLMASEPAAQRARFPLSPLSEAAVDLLLLERPADAAAAERAVADALALRRPELARRLLEEARASFGESAEFCALAARLALLHAAYDRAEAEIARGLALRPGKAALLGLAAQIRSRTGRPLEAAAILGGGRGLSGWLDRPPAYDVLKILATLDWTDLTRRALQAAGRAPLAAQAEESLRLDGPPLDPAAGGWSLVYLPQAGPPPDVEDFAALAAIGCTQVLAAGSDAMNALEWTGRHALILAEARPMPPGLAAALFAQARPQETVIRLVEAQMLPSGLPDGLASVGAIVRTDMLGAFGPLGLEAFLARAETALRLKSVLL